MAATFTGAAALTAGFTGVAIGALAIGALAIGALAIGALASVVDAAAFTGALPAEAFAVTFEPATLDPATLETSVLETVDLVAAAFETVALGATFAVLFGIGFLLLEDATVLPGLRTSFVDAEGRRFVALRRAATAFFTALEAGFAADFEDFDALFLRVF